MSSYLRPHELGDALRALRDGGFAIIAGGTDYYPARVERAAGEDVLDISALAELRRIAVTPEYFRIGAGVTWTDLIRAELPPCFDGLKLAAREIGGVQIQNAATVVGNVCNASPAADSLPNLLALDAEVELTSVDECRRMPVADYVTGNRQTRRRTDELLTALLIPRALAGAHSDFLKLGARRYLVISIAMVAAVLETDQNRVRSARVAIGACSVTARRLPALEAALTGQAVSELGSRVDPQHLAPLSPIDDVRATAAYRRAAALVLLRRLLDRVGAAA
jgi:CO/xanthine dehydrogenase FAD-binding subunit